MSTLDKIKPLITIVRSDSVTERELISVTRKLDKLIVTLPEDERREVFQLMIDTPSQKLTKPQIQELVRLSNKPKHQPITHPKRYAPRKSPYKKKDAHNDPIKKMHSEGKNDVEIGKALGITASHAGRIRRMMKLPKISPVRSKIDNDTMLLYFKNGFTDKEIAELLNMSKNAVNKRRNKLRPLIG